MSLVSRRKTRPHPSAPRVTAPFEQRDTDLGLELPDLLAERGLRGVQPAGGAREAQLLGHGDEVPQVAQFHPARLDGTAMERNPETLHESSHVLRELPKSLSPPLPFAVDCGTMTTPDFRHLVRRP